MDGLRILRVTCKSMLDPCCDRDAGRQLALDWVPVKDMQNTDPEGYDVFVRSLAAAGNPVAGFLAGVDDILGVTAAYVLPSTSFTVLPRPGTEGRPMWRPSSSTGSTAGPTPTALHLRT
jgi:hypothetical protein